MTWIRHRRVGRADVYSLTDGQFRLDGGAMFGTVPKTLWAELAPPDERNRIGLRINPLLIRFGGKNILVETGMDALAGEKFNDLYAVNRDATVFAGLASLGLAPSEIDLVVNTHLHFDHVGGNVVQEDSGIVPAFPRARYIVQRQEFEDATHPHERNRASYHPVLFEPVFERGQFELVDGSVELIPGLQVLPVPGHCLGQQAVVLESDGEMLVYTADLLPTAAHAPYPYIMGYDLYPVTTLEVRKRWFPEWAERKAIVCPPHDPEHAFGHLVPSKRGFLFETLEAL